MDDRDEFVKRVLERPGAQTYLERDREKDLALHFSAILDLLGYNPEDNPHVAATPRRAAKAWLELTQPEGFGFTVFRNTDIDQMVVCQDIPFFSLCAHHILPFYGKAHLAYIPQANILGLSKLARTVDYFARALTVQEELTKDVMDFLVENVDPKGAAVVMQAHHLCMAMRGVERPGHLTTTSAMYGVFLDSSKAARSEFFSIINGGTNG